MKTKVKKSNREARPYLVFQIDRAARAKLKRKTQALKKAGKPGGSMQEFVEMLVKKAI